MISRDWIALNTSQESADDGRPINIAAGTLDERREFGGWITFRLFESAIWNETHRPSHFLACVFAQAYDSSVRQGGFMGRINVGRVVLGGIVAGIVADVLGYVVDGVLLASQWAEGMKALGRPDFTTNQLIGFNIIGLAAGIFTMWLYAAIRPRYGAGPRTAMWAGLAVWFAGVLLPNVGFMGAAGLFPINLALMTTVGGIVEWVLAALAGAALYQEGASAPQSMSARA